MRKLTKGGSAHSFGIHVAKMAGMPTQVVSTAERKLKVLEKSHQEDDRKEALKKDSSEMQLSFINLDDPLLEELRDEIIDLDINTLTPVEALMKLNSIKRRLGEKLQLKILKKVLKFKNYFTFAIPCESSSGVEHHLAKVRVAGSNPVFRSTKSFARVVELVDTLDLKSNDHCIRAGSSPASVQNPPF